MNMKQLFYKNNWTCAYRVITDKSLLEAESSPQKFKEISFPKNCWGADPFLLLHDGKYFVYCEFTNEKKGKSVIAFKELYPSESKQWNIAYEFKKHVSYPCVFCFLNNVFMIPETAAEKKVVILKLDLVSGKWVEHSTIIENERYVDSTFAIINEKPCVFLYKISNDRFRELFVGELSADLSHLISINKVMDYKEKVGRPAGSVINKGGKCYRAVQPGIEIYGEKIEFYSFSLFKGQYEEKLIKTIKPTDVDVGGKQLIGIHTYNRINEIEVIDVLVKSKFKVFRPLTILFKRTGMFGYGMYEKKGKYLGKI